MQQTLTFVRLDHRAKLPTRAHTGDAGLDLCSIETRTLRPSRFHPFKTGLSVAIPKGHEGQVRARSGLAAKHGLSVLNSPGTIDSSYRGEILVILVNHGKEPFWVEEGARIAQLVVARFETMKPVEGEALDKTERGIDGLGSTGL